MSKRRIGLQRPVRPVAQTGQTGRAGKSNSRPVRPVTRTGQTGRSQTARQQSSKCQILSKRSPNSMKLEGKLRNYPVNISQKDLTQKIHGSREIEERSKRIGVFSRTQNRQFVRTHDSRGLALGYMHRNRSKEFIKPRNQGLFSSKQETHQKRRIKPKTQERRGTRCSAHTSELQINFIH